MTDKATDVWKTNKYYVDGQYDINGKIVVKEINTNEVVAKVDNIDSLYIWLKENNV